MAKTTNEKITSIEEQIQQLENQRKQLIKQQTEENRKARTKRLIERGAILESLIPDPANLTNEQIKAFLEKTIRSDYAAKMLNLVKTPPVPAPTPKIVPSAKPPGVAAEGKTGETARVSG